MKYLRIITFIISTFLLLQCKEDPEPKSVFKAKVDGMTWESTKDYPMVVVDKAGSVKPHLKGSVVDMDGRVKSEVLIMLNVGIVAKKYSGAEAELFYNEDNYRKSWQCIGSYTFVIEKFSNNKISGYFSFKAENQSPVPLRLITEGVFENVPVVEENTANN